MTATDPAPRAIEDRLLVIETRLEYVATKADLHDALGTQIRWMVGLVLPIYALLIAAMIFLYNAKP